MTAIGHRISGIGKPVVANGQRSTASAGVDPESRIPSLDVLRGIAALSVAWFHFTANNPGLPAGHPLRHTGSKGWLGVEIFFVISGFVIPLALHRVRYGLRDYGKFILRRVLRLDPPYLVAIAVTVALGYASAASPDYKGEPYHVTLIQLLLHLGYLNAFFEYPWINAVFWTLAIEFQFYLILGLIFPLLASSRPSIRMAVMVTLCAMAVAVPADRFVFHYLFLFLLGIVTFQLNRKMVSRRFFLGAVAFFAAGTFVTLGGWIAAAGTITALTIAFWNVRSAVLQFFGAISYPVYLLHGPIGGRIINYGSRVPEIRAHPLLVLEMALLVTTAAAYLLHRFVERPARRWSSSIRYPHSAVPVIESASL
jgi:peptidoglycan/LPS O-acetylase OafA/YrhL